MPYLTPRLHPRGPVDDQGVADTALVGVPLEHLVRRREGRRPPGGVVVVGVRAPELVDHREVLGLVVGVAAEDLALVHRTVGAALTGRPVVGAVDDEGVVELTGLLEVVDDAADLRVGVLGEAGENLRHAAEHVLLVVVQVVPRAYLVRGGERAVRHRVQCRQVGVRGEDAALDHAGEDPLAVGLVAVVEHALVPGDVLLRSVVRGVIRAGAEPQVPGLLRLGLLDVANHLQRLVCQVLRQVVALLGGVGLLDVAVVLGEGRVPVVGLTADESVEAVVALRERPVLLGRARGPLVDRDVVVLADPERRPSGVAQQIRHRDVRRWDVRVVSGEAGGRFGNRRETVEMVISSGQERRARRRTQRGGVPLGVRQAVLGEAVHRRHRDASPVRRPGCHPGVVVQHDEDVGGALRRLVREKGVPVRDRIPYVQVDGALEFLGHSRSSVPCAKRDALIVGICARPRFTHRV